MARWFLLSYDYSNYDVELNDFRKVIIETLRKRKVVEMYEYVETTILFLDPTTDTTNEKLDFWEEEFDDIEYLTYIIAPVLQTTDGAPRIRSTTNKTLDANFQKLVRQVIAAEIKPKK